jgi:ABC-type multidrug transport system permease subunit
MIECRCFPEFWFAMALLWLFQILNAFDCLASCWHAECSQFNYFFPFLGGLTVAIKDQIRPPW